jgi:hypothetical protein
MGFVTRSPPGSRKAMKLKNGVKQNLGIINILLLSISTGSVWVADYSKLINLLSLCFIIFSLTICAHKNVSSSTYIVILSYLMSVCIILSHGIIFSQSINVALDNYVNLIIRLLYALMLYIYFDISKVDITRCFKIVLNLFMLHSLLGFIFYFLFPEKLFLNYGSSGIPGKTIYFIFYYSQLSNLFGFMVPRSQSIFWEPGVLQLFLNLLLYLELFYFRPSLSRLALILLSVLLTFSSTGYLVAFLIILYFMLYEKRALLTLKSCLMLLIMFCFSGFFIYLNLSKKLLVEQSISFASRLYDFEKSITIITNNPILGLGFSDKIFGNYEFESSLLNINKFSFAELFDYSRGNTNSIMMLYVYFGIAIASVFLVVIYNQSLFKHRVLFFVILVLTNVSEPLLTNNLYLYIYLSGFAGILGRCVKRRASISVQ